MILMLLVSLIGCNDDPETGTGDQVVINPISDAGSTQTKNVTLYYKYAYTDMLAGQSRSIIAPVNERIELVVLNELIAGPGLRRTEFVQILNSSTKVQKITNDGSVLTIIFSKDLLNFIIPDGLTTREININKRLAFYSIVNTMIEVSDCSKVQILVDTDGNGKGERISLIKAGFEQEGFLGPLGFNAENILTPQNTMLTVFDAMLRKDYEEIYYYVAFYDTDNKSKPDEGIFVSRMFETLPTLESFDILNTIISNDGQTAYLLSNYSLRYAGNLRQYSDIPIKLIKENDTWKIRYSHFEKLFLEV